MAESVIPKSLANDVNTLNNKVTPLTESALMNGHQHYGLSDFDDAPLNSIVWVNGTLAHAPLDSSTSRFAGHVFTVKPLTTHGFQFALRYGGSDFYVRTYADNAWGRWFHIGETTS